MEAKAYTAKLFQEWMINPPTNTIQAAVAKTLMDASRLVHNPYEFDWLRIRNEPDFDGFVSTVDTAVLLIPGDDELEITDIVILHANIEFLTMSKELPLFKETRFSDFLAELTPLILPLPYLS